MKCSLCGRRLRDPKSRELGYGPVCRRKVFGEPIIRKKDSGTEKKCRSFDQLANYDVPGQMSLDDYLKSDT